MKKVALIILCKIFDILVNLTGQGNLNSRVRLLRSVMQGEVNADISELSNLLTLEKALIAKELDADRGKIALGMTREQLFIAKQMDYQQLKEAFDYFQSQENQYHEPQSLLAFDAGPPQQNQSSPFNVLLLADTPHSANVIQDYIDAFAEYSINKICTWNPRKARAGDLGFALSDFEVIIIHYTICTVFDTYMPKYLAQMISEFKGLKIQIIQDEWRWINRTANTAEMLGVDVIISSLAPENIKKVYHHYGLSSVQKFHSIPGYIPEYLLHETLIPMDQRKIHLSYRGREYSPHFGMAYYEKSMIGQQVQEGMKGTNLCLDISNKPEDRLFGQDWINLIKHSKAVLAVEGGVSLFDFDDLALYQSQWYTLNNRGASDLDLYENALKEYDKNIIHRTITPRIFEAICLKTALILYPGRYSDVLTPWKHYIPLERDGSNMDEIASLLRDDDYLSDLVENTYKDIALDKRYHFESFVHKLDKIILDSKQSKEAIPKTRKLLASI